MADVPPPMTDADVERTIAFFMELDRLKGVERRNRLADGSRRENTAEHSWHLGMAALVFAGHATEPVDVARGRDGARTRHRRDRCRRHLRLRPGRAAREQGRTRAGRRRPPVRAAAGHHVALPPRTVDEYERMADTPRPGT
ncbi:MAG: HD domain-containing protein [Ilumatobacteraceae bacterium]